MLLLKKKEGNLIFIDFLYKKKKVSIETIEEEKNLE